MNKPNALIESASQTAGPYVHIGCVPSAAALLNGAIPDLGAPMISGDASGERVTIKGQILDGDGQPVKDAILEIWQADAEGLFNSPEERRGVSDPNFTGWGRLAVDFDDASFCIETLKPGRIPWPEGGQQAPYLAIMVAARGINLALHTRIYFSDETAANQSDPVLSLAGEGAETMIAQKSAEGVYDFTIRLQGEGETVFLDF